jgi:phosphatidate cytidylyltransferase
VFKYRLISGTVLFAFICSSLFLKGIPGAAVFTVLAMVLLLGGMTEFYSMTEKIGFPAYRRPGLSAATLLVLGISIPAIMGKGSAEGQSILIDLLMSFVIISGFLRAMQEDDLKEGIKRQLMSLAGYVYIVWSLSFLLLIYFAEGVELSGRYLLVYMILVTKFSDIGAYCTGMTTHKLSGGKNHKIAPRLSPGKSWEGFIGGMIFSVLVALILEKQLGTKLTYNNKDVITPYVAVGMGMIAATLGFIGDVCESIFKRTANVKDSGNTIPGMGGVLDVLDSLILVAPLYYLYLKVAVL